MYFFNDEKLLTMMEAFNLPTSYFECNQECEGKLFCRCTGCGAWIKHFFPKIYYNPFIKDKNAEWKKYLEKQWNKRENIKG